VGRIRKHTDPSCACCGATGVSLKDYDMRRPLDPRDDGPRPALLCDLCASTMTSTYSLQYADYHDRDTVEVMKVVCFVGNAILRELRKRR